MKFYFICQLGYWFHALPELYFQKTKKVSVCACRPETRRLYPVFPSCFCCIVSRIIFFFYPPSKTVSKTSSCKYLDQFFWHLVLRVYHLGGYSTSACVHLHVSSPHRRRLHSQVSPRQLVQLCVARSPPPLQVLPCCPLRMNSCLLVPCSLNRLGLVLLVLHYFVELLFHVSRLVYFSNENRQTGLVIMAGLFFFHLYFNTNFHVFDFCPKL